MKPSAQAPRARLVTIDADHAGQRLDNFIAYCFRGVPRSRIYRSLRTGEVRVNRGRARQTYRLKEGDQVRLPPLAGSAPGPERPRGDDTLAQRLERAVLFEDEHLLVLDKPAGIPVHAGSGREFGLIEAIRAHRAEHGFLELVHRLDQETSGCLLLAKRRPVLVALHEALRLGQVDKRYRVLLKGCWRGGGRRVEAPLRRGVGRGGERVVRVDGQGQDAATAFTPLAVGSTASLMEARLLTGRTHQIRVHAARVLGMPVAGDPRYGCREFNRTLRESGLSRMFLHAQRLSFTHPVIGALQTVRSPLPEALGRVLDALGIATPSRSTPQ